MATSEQAWELLSKQRLHPDLQQQNPYVTEVLQYIADQQQLPEINITVTPEELSRGF
jgi:hypothetical protein